MPSRTRGSLSFTPSPLRAWRPVKALAPAYRALPATLVLVTWAACAHMGVGPLAGTWGTRATRVRRAVRALRACRCALANVGCVDFLVIKVLSEQPEMLSGVWPGRG